MLSFTIVQRKSLGEVLQAMVILLVCLEDPNVLGQHPQTLLDESSAYRSVDRSVSV